MQQNLARVAYALLTLFGVQVLGLTYWQIARSNELWSSPGNRRPALFENRVARGGLYDRNGEPIARSKVIGSKQKRETHDPLANAHVVGYLSAKYGRAGLEGKYDAELSGLRRAWTWQDMQDWLVGEPRRGNDVFLTLDRRLQVAAFKALGKRRGAVVAVAPATGEVLALVSAPSYDPDRLDADWKRLNADANKPLVARATQGLYPPGSAFKAVTYAVNAERGAVPLGTTYECNGTLQLDKYVVHESEGHAHGRVDLPRALAKSCNLAFAQIAMSLGATEFERSAHHFGLGERIAFDLPLTTSFLRQERNVMTRNQLAQSGFGQGQVTVTPMQMALAIGTIANGGVLMEPQLVREVRTYEGKALRRFPPRAVRQVIKPEAAQSTLDAMALTTTVGTAAGMFDRLPFTVGGKTGTAQNPHGRPHAWFVCVAPANAPKIAVAVLIENAGYGARAAAPVARRMLEEWSVGGAGTRHVQQIRRTFSVAE